MAATPRFDERDFERELTTSPVNMNPHEASALARGLGLIARELRENHETMKAGFLRLDERLFVVEADVATLKTDVGEIKAILQRMEARSSGD